jgi:hypothetical protein
VAKSARRKPGKAVAGIVDDEALSEILAAVGAKFCPAGLNRLELRYDIEFAPTCLETIAQLKKRSAVRRRLEDIKRAEKKLIALLVEDKDNAIIVDRDLRPLLARMKDHLAAGATTQNPFRGSALQGAVWSLGNTYQKHFKRPAKPSRTRDGKLCGPFIRFADAALRKLGISNNGKPYSLETIAAAMRGRRKAT